MSSTVSSLKPNIGKRSTPFREQITSQQIASFCKAVGSKQDLVAPPTFMTVFRKGEFELFQQLGIELSRILHTEQEYHYESAIQAGDRVLSETILTQVHEKQTASTLMQFVTFETEVQVEEKLGNRKIGRAKTTIVIRNSNPTH